MERMLKLRLSYRLRSCWASNRKQLTAFLPLMKMYAEYRSILMMKNLSFLNFFFKAFQRPVNILFRDLSCICDFIWKWHNSHCIECLLCSHYLRQWVCTYAMLPLQLQGWMKGGRWPKQIRHSFVARDCSSKHGEPTCPSPPSWLLKYSSDSTATPAELTSEGGDYYSKLFAH